MSTTCRLSSLKQFTRDSYYGLVLVLNAADLDIDTTAHLQV